MPIIDRTPKMRDVIITEGDLVQGTSNGGEVRLPIGPVAGRIRRKIGENKLSWDDASFVDVRDYGAVGDGTTDDTAAIQAVLDDSTEVFIPPLTFRTTSWLKAKTNLHLYGSGPDSIIANDQTNVTVDKRACLLVGNHHPANMATQTAYVLNAITRGDPTVTCTTAGDAANFTVGQLVIVGSATNLSGVSRHAQLNKVTGISSGTISLRDPIESTISDGRIWTITGTDASTGEAITAVENVIIENLGFRGRSAIASKGAVFGGIFRNLWMHSVDNFWSTNMLTNVLIENLQGQYAFRYLEFAFNSYNVTARNWKGRFIPSSGSGSGGTLLPMHIGEQPYRLLLDDVQCHVDALYTANAELIQVKGSEITLRKCDFRHNGNAGSYAISIPDSSYTGFNFERIVFEACRLAAPSKARIALIGGASLAAENPKEVHFLGGELNETVTGESLWFQAGGPFTCSMRDRTTKTVKVSATARYPMLNGYRRF